MSSFGSSNLFGAASSPAGAATTSYGLRQRNVSATSTTNQSDENSHPNNVSRDNIQVYGKWGAMQNVRAPPRMSRANSGKFNSIRSATNIQQQQSTTSNRPSTGTNQQAIVSVNEQQQQEDLSLWVIGYGYRNETHFRALYRQLESCGTITARRGGLSCFGDPTTTTNTDNGNNWVAVRYDSALCAQKALCQHGNFVSIGGSTMVVGVMPLSESDAVVKLGINLRGSSESVKLSGGSYNNNKRKRYELRTEADILLYEDEQQRGDNDGNIIDDQVTSSLDSFCGKVLAWFFSW